MSLNISVTSPSALTALLMSGRRASTDEATSAMERLALLDSLPWARILSASTRSSQAEPAPMRRRIARAASSFSSARPRWPASISMRPHWYKHSDSSKTTL